MKSSRSGPKKPMRQPEALERPRGCWWEFRQGLQRLLPRRWRKGLNTREKTLWSSCPIQGRGICQHHYSKNKTTGPQEILAAGQVPGEPFEQLPAYNAVGDLMKAYGIRTLGVHNCVKLFPKFFSRHFVRILYNYFHIPLLIAVIYLLFKVLS